MTQRPLKDAAQRVQAALEKLGFGFEIRELPQSTRTSEEAAAAIGCELAQIAKSLIFKGRDSGDPILVMASGVNRVDEKVLARLAGEKIGRADADFVRQKTGFSIGGVPPTGHLDAPRTYIDRDLLDFEEIWAAAGTPNAVFRLRPADLITITRGEVADLKK